MKILIFILLSISIFSQVIDKKWAIIQDIEDRIVYIDTSTLKLMNNQISVWTNIYYREAIELSPFQPKARSVRSQFLINPVTRKFQVIGSIYYDDKGAMVSESSSSRFGIGNFQSNVDDTPGMEVVLSKSQEFLNSGTLSSEPSQVDFSIAKESPIVSKPKSENDSSKTENDLNDEVKNEFYRINKSGKVVYTTLPDIKLVNEINQNDKTEIQFEEEEPIKNFSETEQVEETPINTEVIEETLPIQPIVEKEIPIEEVVTEEKPIETPQDVIEQKRSSNYNLDNERNETNTIFTDGNLFVVQVSSWKTSSVAKNEVDKLIKRGYNAFIHEVYIEAKRATYNRVRVGYFNSLNEAKEIERNIKRGN